MKLQTRLSGLLFILLFCLAFGSTLILQDELRKSADAHGLVLDEAQSRASRTYAEGQASAALRGIETLLRSRQLELEVHARLAASSTALPQALQSSDPAQLAKLESWLSQAHPAWRLHLLLNAQGRAVGLSSTAEGPLDPRHFSMLEPPSVASSVSLKTLMEGALAGKSLSGIETFSADLLALLTGQASEAPGKEQGLLLWAIQPVLAGDAGVVGAVLLGVDLARDEAFVQQVNDLLDSEGSAALVVGGRYARRMGSWVPEGISAPETGQPSPHWEKIQTSGQVSLTLGKTLLLARGLKSLGGGVVGALEVHVPLRDRHGLDPATEADDPTLELRQHGMGLIGILAVLLLTGGILVSRTLWSPLARLVKKAEAASTGKLDESFKEVMMPGEIGALARSFDRMRVSLKKLLERSSSERSG